MIKPLLGNPEKEIRKEIIKRNMDCSFRIPFEIEGYRHLVEIALRGGLRYCQVSQSPTGMVNVRSLRSPNYSLSVMSDLAGRRFMRWWKWIKQKKGAEQNGKSRDPYGNPRGRRKKKYY